MPDPREPYGRLVHDTRLACEAERAATEGRQLFNLGAWEERDPAQRELDMRIGAAVAAAERDALGPLREALRRHLASFTDPEGVVCAEGACARLRARTRHWRRAGSRKNAATRRRQESHERR